MFSLFFMFFLFISLGETIIIWSSHNMRGALALHPPGLDYPIIHSNHNNNRPKRSLSELEFWAGVIFLLGKICKNNTFYNSRAEIFICDAIFKHDSNSTKELLAYYQVYSSGLFLSYSDAFSIELLFILISLLYAQFNLL